MYGATIGRLGILGIEATLNQACCAFAKPTLFNPKFVFYWLWMRRPVLISLATGGGQPNLSQDDLRQIRIPIPKLPEQQSIVDFLDDRTAKLDALLEKKRALIGKLKEKRNALISRTVTKGLSPEAAAKAGLSPKPKLKPSGMSWLGEIPEHWSILKLNRIIDPFRRITYGIVQPGEGDADGRYMVRGKDYSRGWAKQDTVFRVSAEIEEPYKRARLFPGDVVLTIVGAGVGNTAVVP